MKYYTRIFMDALKKPVLVFVLVFGMLGIVNPTSVLADVDHSLFTEVLKSHVNNGMVNYKALRKDERLPKYVSDISKVKTASLKGSDAMAFWINVYNAMTLTVVCSKYPVNSIMDIESGQVWKKYTFIIDGKKYTLEQVENNILRPMGDARIHFALVCAAQSCPPLRSEAYTSSKLNAQLTDQARSFLAQRIHNVFDHKTKRGTLSRIFEWYASDFGSSMDDLVRYVGKYAPSSVSKSLTTEPESWKFEFGHYDWKLNE